MGIGYVDSVVVYNRYINGLMETKHISAHGLTMCVWN